MNKEAKLRKEIVRYGQKLQQARFIAGADGNLSGRLDNDTILITPSGKSKGYLEPQELLIIDLEGNLIKGDSKPSSEYRMHTVIYQHCPDIGAVIHAHPQITTAYTMADKKFSTKSLPEGIISLSNLIWLDYATPSTEDLPALFEPYLPQADIFILKQHGVTCAGSDPEQAFQKMETVEHVARTCFYAGRLGEVENLPKDEIERIKALFKKQ